MATDKKAPWAGKNDETGGATVSVASKLPMPLVLQLHDQVKKYEPVMGGGQREVIEYQKRFGAPTFTVEGNSFPQIKGPHQQLVGGYAITHGVPKAFWDEWLEQQGQSEIVVNNMIFAHEEAKSTTAEATEKSSLKSGMERLDPANLPKGLETANTQKAA